MATAVANHPQFIQTPCRFFVQGKCNRGRNCRYLHDLTPHQANGNNTQANNSTGGSNRGQPSRARGTRSRRRRGNDRRDSITNPTLDATTHGIAGSEEHVDVGSWRTNNYIRTENTPAPVSEPPPAKNEPPPTLEKILGGAMCVRFDSGLEIISVSPITVSSSSIVIENVPVGTPMAQLQALVQPFKPTISPHAIRVTHRGESLRVLVHLDDTVAADEAVKTLDEAEFHGRELAVKALRPNTVSQDVTKIECSWVAASTTAILTVESQQKARVLVNRYPRLERRIRGHLVNATIQPSRFGQPPSVLVVNLPHDATEDEIKEQFECISVALQEPNYRLSATKAQEYILHKFEVDRPEDFKIISRPNAIDSRVRAVITFANATDATAIYAKVNDGNSELLNKMGFTYHLTYSVSFNIPADIWTAVQGDIRSLEQKEREKERRMGIGSSRIHSMDVDERNNVPAKIKIVQRTQGWKVPINVYVNGCGRPAVAAVKAAIQSLLKGTVICDDEGKPLWDAALRGREGEKLINLIKELGVHVYLDYRNRTVTLRGPPEIIESAVKLMKEQYNLLLNMQHELPFGGPLARGGIAAVQAHLGEDMVVVNYATQTMLVRCSPAEVNHVRSLLRSQHPRKATRPAKTAGPGSTNTVEDICPACYDTAEAPLVKTSCGHTYCKDCFQRFLQSHIESRKFPIHCFHLSDDGNTCGTPLSIANIQDALSKADIDHLFETAFLAHVQARPNEYSHCPTADCPTVYTITKAADQSFFTCTQCFLGICTACKARAHHGQTCEEVKAGEKEFQAWKRSAGVKSCPRCKADIEKNDGCNHMSCKCGAHICWHCMKEFDTGEEVYTHMRTACAGTWGERAETVPQPAPARVHAQPTQTPGRQLNHHEQWLLFHEHHYLFLERQGELQREQEIAEIAERRRHIEELQRRRRVQEERERREREQLERRREAQEAMERREREQLERRRQLEEAQAQWARQQELQRRQRVQEETERRERAFREERERRERELREELVRRVQAERERREREELIRTAAPKQREEEAERLRQAILLRRQAELEQARRLKERAAREQAVREQAVREQAAREQAARERAARERAFREQAAREQAARAQAHYYQKPKQEKKTGGFCVVM